MPEQAISASTDLREWLLAQGAGSFPGHGNRDYCAQFQNVESYLFKEVHPEVEKLAMTIDGGYLTDHGPAHIRTVIERASQMIGDPTNRLSPYEVYILLLAIHLHDVGNVFGRAGHEKKLGEIVKVVDTRLGDEAIEIRMIRQIAEAHGGKTPEGANADTIGDLPAKESFLTEDVRMQLLAAILRFADELADDTDRAARLALALDRLPDEARIYHQYAKQLHSVKLRRELQSVELRFSLDGELACKTFKKNGSNRYLLDEIFHRTLKTHTERVYCSRFMRDLVDIHKVDVFVQVYLVPSNITPFTKIEYSLREAGYPDTPNSISCLLPGFDWTGAKLERRLQDATRQAANGQ